MNVGMSLQIVNRESETITSSNFKAETYNAIYKKPIGSLLLSFLELDLKSQSAFKEFTEKWGIGGLLKLSRTALTLYNDMIVAAVDKNNNALEGNKGEEEQGEFQYSKADYEKMLTNIFKECQVTLRRAQAIIKKIILFTLDMNGPKWSHGLVPRQRFYIYQEIHESELNIIKTAHGNNLIIDFEANLTYGQQSPGIKDKIELFNQKARITTEEELVELIKNGEINLHEIYTSGDIVAICYAEIKEMIAKSSMIKKCRRCDLYFMPTNRVDEEYCDRVAKILPDGANKTCKDIGPSEKYNESIKNDPAKHAYKKAYKTRHARIRAKGRTSKAKEEFYAWKNEAETKMEEIKKGTLKIEEFKEWLKNGGAKQNGR